MVEFRPGSESFVKELTTVRDQLVKVVLVYARYFCVLLTSNLVLIRMP